MTTSRGDWDARVRQVLHSRRGGSWSTEIWLGFEFAHSEVSEAPVTASTRWAEGWWHYRVLGLIQPGKGQSSRIDEIMRRSSWRQDHDLHRQRSMDELYQRCDIRLPRQASLF